MYVCTCSLYFLLSFKKKVQLKTDITSRISYIQVDNNSVSYSSESYYVYHTMHTSVYIIYLHPFIYLFTLQLSSPSSQQQLHHSLDH